MVGICIAHYTVQREGDAEAIDKERSAE